MRRKTTRTSRSLSASTENPRCAPLSALLLFTALTASPLPSSAWAGPTTDNLLITDRPSVLVIKANEDDGTELNDSEWNPDGYPAGINAIGRAPEGDLLSVGLRFDASQLEAGERIRYARLRLAGMGGEVQSLVPVEIRGILAPSAEPFSQESRPSQRSPKTVWGVFWQIDEPWLEGAMRSPLLYDSPNLAPIINEILALPDWGSGEAGKVLAFELAADSCAWDEANYIHFEDHSIDAEVGSPATLEIYQSVYDTFLGSEMLGRVTGSSATVHLYSLLNTDVYVSYGTSPGEYTQTTLLHEDQPRAEGIEIVLDGLQPDTQYYYQLSYREAGVGECEEAEEHTFHTQRASGSPFVFAVSADEHVGWINHLPKDLLSENLHRQTLDNIGADGPDFLISLGDSGIGIETETPAPFAYRPPESTALQMKATSLAIVSRRYLNAIAHSIPYYLVIGNHEGEQGWFYDAEREWTIHTSSAGINTAVRKQLFTNPFPDGFYSGDTTEVTGIGQHNSYYAWEWGDALFVALDPYWHTLRKPHHYGGPATGDRWDWTLGKEQYDWLWETLSGSGAKWKFVFIHHLTGGTRTYGDGGIECAKYKVAGLPTFEWGGEDEAGNAVFAEMRPGWNHGPIHDLMVDTGVTTLFHGHDHFFGVQSLDGIVYLECPRSSDRLYAFGRVRMGGYEQGDAVRSSGHIRVSVGPDSVEIEYVRAYLPGDGENGAVAYALTLPSKSTRAVRF